MQKRLHCFREDRCRKAYLGLALSRNSGNIEGLEIRRAGLLV